MPPEGCPEVQELPPEGTDRRQNLTNPLVSCVSGALSRSRRFRVGRFEGSDKWRVQGRRTSSSGGARRVVFVLP